MVDQVLDRTGFALDAAGTRGTGTQGRTPGILEELRAQGFIRARIDGEVIELDKAPTLDLRRKHNIEVVVDRFKVREDLKLRLAESFETALRLADGLARVVSMDDQPR